jgi:UDP-N-acetylglucosamine--N-acetylmuramyl-(pentapeptide) pyrophosphoryl-undecaprenol N-acetylglucosamine transferase
MSPTPKIVVTGGGSGGHITPLLAVAAELKRLRPHSRIVYIGQRGDSLGDIPAGDVNIDEAHMVFAGKFRRYHGEGWRQLLDIPTGLKNIRDLCYIVIGLVQSYRLMKKIHPDVVFSRGGFISVPVALGAALRHVPYMTHDSDPIPSLANRIIAPWAAIHAVALPAEVYPYPSAKTFTTGIPLGKEFKPVTATLQKQYRIKLHISSEAQFLFIIGGGLGSQRVNQAVAEVLPHLLGDFPALQVAHVVGRANQTDMQQQYDRQLSAEDRGRVQVLGFISDVYRYSGAADVVISRAGATNLAEFALQGKACIVIPSPFLTAGHQLKNAQYLAEQGAALVIDESELAADPNRLAKQVTQLLHNPAKRAKLSVHMASFARPQATQDLAQLILAQVQTKQEQAKEPTSSHETTP